MKWFQSLSTIKKISSLIILMSFFLIITGLISYFFTRKANHRMIDLYEARLLAIQALDEARVNSRVNQFSMFRLVNSNDKNEQRYLFSDIKERTKLLNQNVDLYLTTPLDSYEQSQISNLKNCTERSNQLEQTIFRFILSENRYKAINLYPEYASNIDKFNTVLRKLAYHNIYSAKTMYQAGLEDARSTDLLILLVILGSLGLSIPLSLLIARMITKPLTELDNKMSEVASGNLDIEPVKVQSKDEIGRLSESFNTMTQKIILLINREKLAKDKETLLRNVINEILTSQDFREAVEGIVGEVGRIFEVERVILRLYDTGQRTFSDVVSEFTSRGEVLKAKDKGIYPKNVDEYFAQNVMDKKDMLIIDDIDNAKYPDYLKEYYKSLSIKSALISPIIYKDNLIAILLLTDAKKANLQDRVDLNLLKVVIQQISIGAYVFYLSDRLIKALVREKDIRDLILDVGKYQNQDQIFDILLAKLAYIYKVNRCIYIHLDDNRDLTVKNEFLSDENQESLLHKKILAEEHTGELINIKYKEIRVISSVDEEIKNNSLKAFLLNNNIESFLLYPITTYQEFLADKSAGFTMICSQHPRKWLTGEIESFRLIIDTISLIFLEISQKQETENIRNTFIATLTHDLKSPLNAEQKALEAILSRRFGESLDDFSEYLQAIYKTNNELLHLVDNILSVYHIESGEYRLNLELYDIKEIICNAVNTMKPLAKDNDSEIVVHIEEDIPPVMLDSTEINRVILNLISNAIKHNTKGTQIKVNAKKTDEEVQVSVQDNGSGIPEAEKPKIFQRYPTAKRKIGTGLGLYLSKQIIDAHNGKIWFETEANKGTTFYFTLPIS